LRGLVTGQLYSTANVTSNTMTSTTQYLNPACRHSHSHRHRHIVVDQRTPRRSADSERRAWKLSAHETPQTCMPLFQRMRQSWLLQLHWCWEPYLHVSTKPWFEATSFKHEAASVLYMCVRPTCCKVGSMVGLHAHLEDR
jgi:hypothetical protein